MDFINARHKDAANTIPKLKLRSGSISTKVACFWKRGCRASIFNYSIQYERHYVNGELVDTPNISPGDSFTNCFYEENIEYTEAMAMATFGIADGANLSARIINESKVCQHPENLTCSIITKHRVVSRNFIDMPNYEWTIDNGTIISGQGTDEITVMTISEDTETINLECTLSNQCIAITAKSKAMHYRQDKPRNCYLELVPKIALVPEPGLCPSGGRNVVR